MKKKIIVSAILLLLLAGSLLIRLGIPPQSSPAPAPAPSVSAGATASATAATTAQQTEEPSSTPEQTGASFAPIHYTTDNSKLVKAKKDDTLKLAGKKAVIRFDDDDGYPLYMGCFYVIQKDGSVDKYPHRTDNIYSTYQTKNWLYYYTMDDSDDLVTTLHRVPIQQQGGKTKVRLEERKQLKKLDIDEFIYGTDQYIICTIGNNLIKYNIKSKKSQRIDPGPVLDGTSDIYIKWEPFCDFFENPIISKDGDIYLKKITEDEDDNMSSVAFYKFNTVTFKKTKLSDSTNAVFSDPAGQIVIMESDEKWNYAYYPGTGKRTRCGQNMMDEWGTDDMLNDFDEEADDEDYEDDEDDEDDDYEDEDEDDEDEEDDDYDKDLGYMSAANRDLVGWIREKNPCSYQEKNGHFSCVNHFVYNDRMYVKVTFRWKDAVEIEKDEAGGYGGEHAQMLFSYSLKNYKGIRPETELNRIMQKYSSRTYQDVEDSIYYHYTATGDFSFLFKDVLVFEYDDFYVLYHVGTGAYRKIDGKNKDVLYLNELHEE